MTVSETQASLVPSELLKSVVAKHRLRHSLAESKICDESFSIVRDIVWCLSPYPGGHN